MAGAQRAGGRLEMGPLAAVGVGAAVLLAIAVAPVDVARWMGAEGSLLEDLSAVGYGVAAAVCAFALVRRSLPRRRLAWVALWLVLALLFLGEEVAWFSRVLDIEATAITDRNLQGELTLHNLDIFQAQGLLESLRDGQLDWRALVGPTALFRLGFALHFALLPLLAWRRPGLAARAGWAVPPTGLLVPTLTLVALGLAGTALAGSPRSAVMAEAVETVYALAIAAYAAGPLTDVAWRVRMPVVRRRAPHPTG